VKLVQYIFGTVGKDPVKQEPRLIKDYGGSSGEWTKKSAIYTVERDGREVKAKIHYFNHNSIGKVEQKVKRWLK